MLAEKPILYQKSVNWSNAVAKHLTGKNIHGEFVIVGSSKLLISSLLKLKKKFRINREILISNISFRFPGHSSFLIDVCCVPAGNLKVSYRLDGSLASWILNITRERTFLKGHQAAAHSVAFTPDRRQMLSASDDKTIKLWNVQKSKYVKQIVHC